MQRSLESQTPILTIYATVLPNREICQIKIISKDGLEINLPNQVFPGNKRAFKNRIACFLRAMKHESYCKCGNFINPEISILQCPVCLNRSLPSIMSQSKEGESKRK